MLSSKYELKEELNVPALKFQCDSLIYFTRQNLHLKHNASDCKYFII